jgi:uncharacterized protein (DUF2236 family)
MLAPTTIASAPPRPGPDSVAWRIHRERIMLLSWGRAILLQFAHPLVAAGVAEHSAFGDDPRANRDRLHRTVQAMLDLIFGTPAQVASAAGRINAIHDRVRGYLREPTGALPAHTPYSAHMPELLLWVHATFVDSALVVYERYVGALTPAERDQYCAESRAIGPWLGIPVETMPASHAELRAYMDRMEASGQIAVGPTALRLMRLLLRARPALLVRGPLLTWLHLPTVGLLPPRLRAAYGLAWPRSHALLLALTSGLCRRLLPLAPPALRYWPIARRAAARWRAEEGGHTPGR